MTTFHGITVFNCIFDQIKAAFVKISDYSSYIFFKLTDPKPLNGCASLTTLCHISQSNADLHFRDQNSSLFILKQSSFSKQFIPTGSVY